MCSKPYKAMATGLPDGQAVQAAGYFGPARVVFALLDGSDDGEIALDELLVSNVRASRMAYNWQVVWDSPKNLANNGRCIWNLNRVPMGTKYQVNLDVTNVSFASQTTFQQLFLWHFCSFCFWNRTLPTHSLYLICRCPTFCCKMSLLPLVATKMWKILL